MNNNDHAEELTQHRKDMNEVVDTRPQTPSDQSEPDIEQNLEAETNLISVSKQSAELRTLTSKANRRGGRRQGQGVNDIKAAVSGR